MDLITNLLPRALPANHSQDGAETFLLVRQDVDRQSGPNLHTQPPLGAVGQRAAQRRPRAVTSPCSSRSAATTNCFSCGAPGRAAPSGSSLRGNRAEFGLGGRRGAGRGSGGGYAQADPQVPVLRGAQQHPPLVGGRGRLRSLHAPGGTAAPAPSTAARRGRGEAGLPARRAVPPCVPPARAGAVPRSKRQLKA